MKTNAVYQLLDLVQGSSEWLEVRNQCVPASEVATIMDKSPYKTPLQLFEQMVLKKEKPVGDFQRYLFQRGHDAEAAGREWIKENLGLEFEPVVMKSNRIADLMASLDGFNFEKNIGFEAKYFSSEKTFERVKAGEIPEHHLIQMQAQMLVSGAEKVIYFAMTESGDAVMKDIFPDLEMQKRITDAIPDFMARVRKGEAPDLSDRDYFKPNDPRFEKLAQMKIAIDSWSDEYETLKKQLEKEYAEQHPRIRAGGLTITRSVRKGNIQYAKVPALKGLDLEQYRSAPSVSWTVRIDSGAKSAEKESA